ncbi:uncharacterized protein LOC111052832 isoform X2 [Nilaparvata lugens]|uniref:uncharacterized protein LOC111052832 isoform X2 n=1 Tax=Nilaparvata lugens TaxID=108931 RepID=UPI00193D2D76|nr:uncharacterized protein LOC111052832 isoform X2 [Nilaparvata lugens]
MRESLLLIGLCLGIMVWNAETSMKSQDVRVRESRSPSFRYRPNTTGLCHGPCTEVHPPQHRHLLLVAADDERQQQLRSCSVTRRLSAAFVADIEEEPGVLVLSADLGLLEPMVAVFGNVSVFVESEEPSRLARERCRSMPGKCFALDSLIPVLEQLSRWRRHHQTSASLLDVPDARWLPVPSPTALADDSAAGSARLQLQQLVASLCLRHRRFNRFLEMVAHRATVRPAIADHDHDMIDSSTTMITEASLSLRDILPLNPKHYDKNRAPKMQGQPTMVYFHVTVLSLDSINEESMTYVADIFLAQSWRDPRLRLPENMSEEYRILDVDWLHNIWRPDCFFKNAKKVTFHEMSVPNHYLWLYHDKTLLYMSKLTLVLSCAMKFESYPHDTQICSMMIESLSHTDHDLVFIWNMTDPLVVNPEIELPQLDISNNYTADCTIEYSTGW